MLLALVSKSGPENELCVNYRAKQCILGSTSGGLVVGQLWPRLSPGKGPPVLPGLGNSSWCPSSPGANHRNQGPTLHINRKRSYCHACTHVCVFIRVHVRVCMCVYVCMRVRVHVRAHTPQAKQKQNHNMMKERKEKGGEDKEGNRQICLWAI